MSNRQFKSWDFMSGKWTYRKHLKWKAFMESSSFWRDDRRGSGKSWVVNVSVTYSLLSPTKCLDSRIFPFVFLLTKLDVWLSHNKSLAETFDCLKLIRRIDRGHLDPFRTTEKIIKPDARMDKPLPNYVRGRCTICFCVINEMTDST